MINNEPSSYYNDDGVVLDPIKLSPKELSKRMVTIAGFEFIDGGYCIACPKCGAISGISARVDLDKKIDFFLKFGCSCYKKH